ncbi:SMP-30/gluconolactonase/LRE family protein [Hymenobacter rubripertinctus]|uniref:Uncharacterized protein n=1 Tax=Hymenobacter rubripertinctus TaxID=2029981 RepID=A0A418QVV4_9BACT|nr:hypothetical protein [Hymenobacter rubripertinctus]RIY09288.1 hypothetical protein D0T11_12740 [Hymenobacter rubripertinctus]
MPYRILLLLVLLLHAVGATAQPEAQNWYFGNNAGLSFAGGQPTVLTNSAMNTYEACAAVSDSLGNLLFYTNSEAVWNRQHQLMPNGTLLGGHSTGTQGAVILRQPGRLRQYYVFTVDACDAQLAGGLRYSSVDMRAEGGLGAVSRRAQPVDTGRVTEKLTVVPHANGRDSWVLVHGWKSDRFYAYLVTAAGLASVPVMSAVGSVHAGGGGALHNANAVGYMKASADGRKIALGIRDEDFELFDFDNATGRLSNCVLLPSIYRSYGVEFSPDGSRLYGTDLDGFRVYQFNLQAGSAAAIAASRVEVGITSGYAGALQRGPDGRIYVAQYNRAYLSVIAAPNALGAACGFQLDVLPLNGRLCQVGLPNNASSPQ